MNSIHDARHPLPIIYVYTVVKAVCKYGLPSYIRISLEQAVQSQPDSTVIMASNYAECAKIGEIVDAVANVVKIDITELVSNRTLEFMNASQSMFEVDFGSELWLTSAYRFFNLEDMMVHYNFSEIMHVEADNLLYGNFTHLLPVLRESYPGLAATPLNANKSFITASVFWIANLQVLKRFNDFLLDLGRNKDGAWNLYLKWLRPFGCCKQGGIDPDESGKGIKPFAVNEMSMLAYYHHLRPEEFFLLPVVPIHNYNLNRHVCNMSSFGPLGSEIPAPTIDGIWDPNSWGQFLGGTSNKKGRDRGFSDASHIAGQAMRTSSCRPSMLCANSTTATSGSTQLMQRRLRHHHHSIIGDHSILELATNTSLKCSTVPFVRCSDDAPWTPLWNLHVHSKHTSDYKSKPCACPV